MTGILNFNFKSFIFFIKLHLMFITIVFNSTLEISLHSTVNSQSYNTEQNPPITNRLTLMLKVQNVLYYFKVHISKTIQVIT